MSGRLKFPLEMELDRTPFSEDGSVLYGISQDKADMVAAKGGFDLAQGKRRVEIDAVFAAEHFKDYNRPVKTIGDYFRFAQSIVGSGYLHDWRPPLIASKFNVFMRAFAIESARLNASAFGLEEHDVESAVFRDSTVLHHWQHYRWTNSGRVIYDITEPVGRAFLETELNVLPEDLTVKEGTCFISVPPELGLKVWHASTGFHDVGGFYVTFDQDELFVCVGGYAHPGRPSNDNALSTFVIPFKEIETVHEWVEEQKANHWGATFLGENFRFIESWMSVIVNTLLYIKYVENDVRHDPDFGVSAKDKAKAQKIPTNKARRKFLDANRANCRYFVLGEQAKTTISSGQSAASSGSGNSPAARFLVRGHWRNQAHGPARALRKLMWIQPHWRGPEDSPVVPPTKVVKVA